MLRTQVRKKSGILPVLWYLLQLGEAAVIPEVNESTLAVPAAGNSRALGTYYMQDAGAGTAEMHTSHREHSL